MRMSVRRFIGMPPRYQTDIETIIGEGGITVKTPDGSAVANLLKVEYENVSETIFETDVTLTFVFIPTNGEVVMSADDVACIVKTLDGVGFAKASHLSHWQSWGGEQQPKKWRHKTLSTPAIVETQSHGRGVVRDVWGYQSEASDPLAGYRVMSWEAE